MRILIAEADPTSRRSLAEALEQLGHEVVEAEDGEQAWRIMEQPGAPKLAILDCILPGQDGLEASRSIRALDLEVRPYLIMLTGQDDSSMVTAGLEAGADDFLGKPFDPGRLQARLNVGLRTLEMQVHLLESERHLEAAAFELEWKNSELVEARDEALKAAQAKADFLANMSHEIRTPMNGVLGMAELLSGTALTDDQRDCVSTIVRSGEGLLSLLNNILDFSKIEAGQLSLEEVQFDLEQLVFDVVDLFRTTLEGRPVELLVDFLASGSRHVAGDPGRVRQILSNLVSNAIKFTEAGHILVEASTTPFPGPGGCLTYHLMVRDTGIGIPPHKQVRLFNPFVQADSSTARKYGGTGLGLTLVKRIAEAMGGRVRMESEEGRGTAMFVDLPLKLVVDPPETAGEASDLAGKRILVIDDLAVNRNLLARQLKARGAITTTADSGIEGLRELDSAHVRGEPFHAVLVDLMMPPGMDGATFGRMVRSDPRCQATALVVLTLTGVRGEPAELKHLGFDGYLLKPISADTLARALVAAMRRSASPSDAPLVTRHSVARSVSDTVQEFALPGRARILMVEDQEVNQVVARRFLELAGAEVEIAADGVAALAVLAERTFDLILMDCQMPVMDGFEATAQIRALEAGTGRHVPIVAMTAHAMAGDRARCLAAGMDDYLTKPIRREVLLKGVSRWLTGQAIPLTEAEPRTDSCDLPSPPPQLGLDMVLFLKLWVVFNQNGREMGEVIIEPYLQRGRELLQSLRASLVPRDVAALHSAAHSLKGSSRTLALNTLGDIAERLDRQAETAPLEALEAWTGEAESAFAAASTYLQAISRLP